MNANEGPIKLAILDDYQNIALKMADWSPLRDRVSIEVFSDHISDPDRLVDRLLPFDIVCVMRERTPLSRQIIERLPRLKLISSTGSRNTSIDGGAAKEHGIIVNNTKGSSTAPIELTWALILAGVRNVASENALLRAGGWQQSVGEEIKGKTLGILGLGNIGSEVARIGRAFGMETIAWSERLTKERADEVGARLVSKDELFRDADIVSIHLVLADATRGLVGARELSQMKPTAWLINTSRGPIVDEHALVTALSGRKLAGAAIDVFDIEPLPTKHSFRVLDNVLATPHIGYVSRSEYEVFYGETVEGVIAWLDGRASQPSTNVTVP
ncbi:MAG: D-2-hydroxyacid dehydrogenase family protein [Methylovirgula sp.]|uniref:D-2-hydroxyacid dehydrogenase family protein n=1 Tax=Methylovirgula sp. TaxID=1978224 RepID=UPI003076163D